MREITFLVEDDNLIELFTQQGYFTGCKNYRRIKDINDEVDILIVSESVVGKEEVLHIKHHLKPQLVYFLFTDGRGFLSDVEKFKEQGITTLPINATNLCTYNIICKEVVPNYKFDTNVFTFFGADSKAGTTMVAQSVAEFIAQNTELKILTIFLNGKRSNYYSDVDNPPTLDGLKTKLFSEILTDNDVLKNCVKTKDNLYMLFGIANYLERRQYNPKNIERLFKTIKTNFDVVIVDAGSKVELGCTIGAIHETNQRYLVTTTSLNTLNDYTDLRQQIFNRLKIDNTKIIINKYRLSEVYTGEELAKLYCSEYLVTVPRVENAILCEYDKKTLLTFDDRPYNTSIEHIANDILESLNVFYEKKYVDKRKMFDNFLGGKLWKK